MGEGFFIVVITLRVMPFPHAEREDYDLCRSPGSYIAEGSVEIVWDAIALQRPGMSGMLIPAVRRDIFDSPIDAPL